MCTKLWGLTLFLCTTIAEDTGEKHVHIDSSSPHSDEGPFQNGCEHICRGTRLTFRDISLFPCSSKMSMVTLDLSCTEEHGKCVWPFAVCQMNPENVIFVRSNPPVFYLQVRIKAQNALSHCLDTYLYSGRTLLPDVFPLLSSDNGVSHEQFKVSHTYIH